jgi:predicted ribosome-associated RNA-binding protein Tma20
MTMGVADMERIGKGIGIEVLTYVGDDSWNVK